MGRVTQVAEGLMVEVRIVFIVDQDLTVSATNAAGLSYSSSFAPDDLPIDMREEIRPGMTFWVDLADDGTPMIFDVHNNVWVQTPILNVQLKWFEVPAHHLSPDL